MGYQDKLKALADARAPKLEADAKAREERDEKELEAVFAKLDEIGGTFEENVLRVPLAPATLPGHIVLRRPTKPEIGRFRAMVAKNPNDRGSNEARANASIDLGAGCVVYPEPDRYAALLDHAAGIATDVGNLAHELSAAGARDEAKK